MNIANQKILAVGQGLALAWMCSISIVYTLSGEPLIGTLGQALGLAIVLIVFGVFLPVGYYSLVVVGSRKRPRVIFVILVVTHTLVMMVLLVLTIAYSYVSVDALSRSFKLRDIFFPFAPGLGFVLVLSSLMMVIYRAIRARRNPLV
jgi:hypothetical protein